MRTWSAETFGKLLRWINLNPGETETRENPTESFGWFCYYAEAQDGAFWSGPPTLRRLRILSSPYALVSSATTFWDVGFPGAGRCHVVWRQLRSVIVIFGIFLGRGNSLMISCVIYFFISSRVFSSCNFSTANHPQV